MPLAANSMSASMPALMVLFVMLTVAVYTELTESRIYNWLTLTSMALGLFIAYLHHTLASSLAGLAIGFGFLFIFYVFGGVGGGDVKLMGAAGALLGVEMTKPALFYTTFIGAFIAMMMFIWRKDFWQRIGMSLQTLAFWQKREATQAAALPAIKVPYGIAIAIGCLLALLASARS